MAIREKDKNSPISAAPVVITTPITPSREAALKGNVTSRYTGSPVKPEKADDVRIAAISSDTPRSEQDVAFQRYIQIEIMNYGHELTSVSMGDWLKENEASLGKDFDPNDKIDNSYAEFQRANSSDRSVTADYEAREYSPLVFNSRLPSGVHHRSNSPNSIIDDGFKAPAFTLSKHEARSALAADIRTVSEMYAPEAGMSPKDFAKVMGGIATIESSFGVIRSVRGTKYESSAGGAFHYLNGTIAGEVRENMSDPRIANRVAALGVNIKDGVTKSEAWTLKEDNVLAGSVLAKRIVEAARANPQLKGDIDALTTRVYQSHNLGAAGANALARGGRQALEALDYKADDNNPMFFRGTTSDAEINGRYKKFVTNAVESSTNLIETAFSGSAPAAILAQEKPQPTSKFAAAAPSREPA